MAGEQQVRLMNGLVLLVIIVGVGCLVAERWPQIVARVLGDDQ